MATKTYGLDVVLTITTGIMVCKDLSPIYDILNHMTGDDILPHQIPSAMDQCSPILVSKWPELSRADRHLPDLESAVKEAADNNDQVLNIVQEWFDKIRREYGLPELFDVAPLPELNQLQRTPVSELPENKTILVFVADESAITSGET